MDLKDQRYLLGIARQALEHFFETQSKITIDESTLHSPFLKEKRGVFVTLYKHEELRGCIGYIEPIEKLYKAVRENILSAAFDDPRFEPLEKDELKDIHIEISVLTIPKKLEYNAPTDLLKKLRPLVDGVIIEKGDYSATYLPQVWEESFRKEDFLSSLCVKAGLGEDEWEQGHLVVYTYSADIFHE